MGNDVGCKAIGIGTVTIKKFDGIVRIRCFGTWEEFDFFVSFEFFGLYVHGKRWSNEDQQMCFGDHEGAESWKSLQTS